MPIDKWRQMQLITTCSRILFFTPNGDMDTGYVLDTRKCLFVSKSDLFWRIRGFCQRKEKVCNTLILQTLQV